LQPRFFVPAWRRGYFRLVAIAIAIAMAVASRMLGSDRAIALIQIDVPTSPSASVMLAGRKIRCIDGKFEAWRLVLRSLLGPVSAPLSPTTLEEVNYEPVFRDCTCRIDDSFSGDDISISISMRSS